MADITVLISAPSKFRITNLSFASCSTLNGSSFSAFLFQEVSEQKAQSLLFPLRQMAEAAGLQCLFAGCLEAHAEPIRKTIKITALF